ncbi:DUF92 domain-containing protein [bacterium]|nr:DUF92 domain-containing protein [bacterium]
MNTFMNLLRFLFHAPKSDWMQFAVFLAGLLLFVLPFEWVRKKIGWTQEVSRKMIHIGVGMLVVFTPYYFQSNRPIIWLALIFIIVNFTAVRSGRLKGMHGTDRFSYGTIFYPLSILILLLVCWTGHKVIFMTSVLIMTLPDALAAIIGENMKAPHRYWLGQDEKSLEGSAAMFFSAWICVVVALSAFGPLDDLKFGLAQIIWIGCVTACMATAFESISSMGSDNFTVPLGSAFILYFMLSQSHSGIIQLSLGIILALFIAVVSCRIRFLSISGSVCAFILAAIIFGAGGWTWALPILAFYISSSILSKTGKVRKRKFDTVFEKSSLRDAGQVLANGGLPGLLIILHTLFPHPVWYYSYLGALAAVNADTWATEIGVLSKTRPRLITTGQPVDHGISGGITITGLIGAFLGAWIIVCSGLPLQPENAGLSIVHPLFWWIAGAGFIATLIDSCLGASLQGQYVCTICRQTTEKKTHCGHPAKPVSGFIWMNNDRVNLICAIFGVFFVIFGWIIGI